MGPGGGSGVEGEYGHREVEEMQVHIEYDLYHFYSFHNIPNRRQKRRDMDLDQIRNGKTETQVSYKGL